MKIAIISDIHSNKYALKECLDYTVNQNIDYYIFLGDYFGYYPWARECLDLILPLKENSFHIIGNHDELMIRETPPVPKPEYFYVLENNLAQLTTDEINWLKSLSPNKIINLDGLSFNAYHGTPEDHLNGRFYPDNIEDQSWFPNKNEVLLMGHTHYPIYRELENGGFIINPGSVGQSRDGRVDASFCIFDTYKKSAEFVRLDFNVESVIKKLEELNWYPRAINALKKK